MREEVKIKGKGTRKRIINLKRITIRIRMIHNSQLNLILII